MSADPICTPAEFDYWLGRATRAEEDARRLYHWLLVNGTEAERQHLAGEHLATVRAR